MLELPCVGSVHTKKKKKSNNNCVTLRLRNFQYPLLFENLFEDLENLHKYLSGGVIGKNWKAFGNTVVKTYFSS